MKIPLLPNNVGKKSVNDAEPKHGHDTSVEETMPIDYSYKFGYFDTQNMYSDQI